MAKQKQKVGSRARKVKTYEAYILGLAIIGLLVGEYGLITNATSADWKAGISMLDVSDGVVQAISDIKFVSEPAVFMIKAVNEFYNQATIAAMQVLDFSDVAITPIQTVIAVNDFYNIASNQMAQVLDLSNYIEEFSPQVAGTSISR